jgi:hypothetical protein
MSDEENTQASDAGEPQSMIEKALAEGPLPGLKAQEKADEALAEQDEEPVGQRSQDEADQLGGFNLRA